MQQIENGTKNPANEVNHGLYLGWWERKTLWEGWIESPMVVLQKGRGLGRMHSPCNILQSIMHGFLKWSHTGVLFAGSYFSHCILGTVSVTKSYSNDTQQHSCTERWALLPVLPPSSDGNCWLLQPKQQKEMQTQFIFIRRQISCCPEHSSVWAARRGMGTSEEVSNLSLLLSSTKTQDMNRSKAYWPQ